MAKIIVRLGAVTPLTENLDVGEPVWDANKAAFGVGNGERNARFYPGIKLDGSLKLNGGRIYFKDSDNDYLDMQTDYFSIVRKGVEMFRINDTEIVAKIPVATSLGNLPAGGTAGQVLAKTGPNYGDVAWINPPAGSGGGSTDLDFGVFTDPPSNGNNYDFGNF